MIVAFFIQFWQIMPCFSFLESKEDINEDDTKIFHTSKYIRNGIANRRVSWFDDSSRSIGRDEKDKQTESPNPICSQNLETRPNFKNSTNKLRVYDRLQLPQIIRDSVSESDTISSNVVEPIMVHEKDCSFVNKQSVSLQKEVPLKIFRRELLDSKFEDKQHKTGDRLRPYCRRSMLKQPKNKDEVSSGSESFCSVEIVSKESASTATRCGKSVRQNDSFIMRLDDL